MTRKTDFEEKIIIIGAGTFGLSTGLELLREGYKNVTLFDPYEVPSKLSAGNDVNKILQSSVEDLFYSELAMEALDGWRNDPIYNPAFNETGIIYTSSSDFDYLESRKEFLRKNNLKYEELTSQKDFTDLVPSPLSKDITSARFKGWEGFYQSENCGWTHAVEALNLTATEIKRLGGKFVFDSVDEIIFDESNGDCIGIRTFSGEVYKSRKIVLAAGAQSYKFLDFKGQLLAKCWTVGHIRLTDEEAKSLRGSPVVLNLDHGFFFEPDVKNDIKLCNEFPGYINISDNNDSIPVYRNQIPKEAENYMRLFIKEVFPSLSTRPFSIAKICWCTDTPDRHFLIGTHPDHKGLILGTGDSGQGFKYMPIIGKYISQVVIQGDIGLEGLKRQAWRWRPEIGKKRDIFDLQGREGGTNIIKDLKSIDEWTDGTNIDEIDFGLLKI